MSRDFKAALRRADDALQAGGLPRAVRSRLDARLFAPRTRTPVLAMVTVALASVLVGFVAVQVLVPRARSVGGFEVSASSPGAVQVAREAAVELAAGAVVFDRSRGVRITSTLRSSVRREPRGIRVLDGQVSFEVEHRAVADGPVRVLVSGGAIEVHGTRFTVVETGAGTGAVELHEGAIDFTDERGVVHVLQPGQTLRWPAPEAEPSVAPELDLSGVPDPAPLPGPMKAPPRTKSPLPQEADWRTFDQRVHAEAVITELGELRSRGAWSDAVRLLERELNRGAPDTRERLSFELGLIYTWQVRDHAAACGHWARHRAEYPEGRFDAEVDRATASLGCER